MNVNRLSWALLLSLVVEGTAGVESCAATDDLEPSVPYTARVGGLWWGEVRNAVIEQSLTMALEDHPPATVRQLQKRAEDDLPAMTAVLKAEGYLAAAITAQIETNRSPVRVTFRADKGPRYEIRSFRVLYTNAVGPVPQPPRELGLRPGSAATVGAVDAAEASILRFLRERGYPRPERVRRDVIRDDTNRTVEVVCAVAPGPKATLGAVEIRGNARVDEGYVRRRVEWTPGAPYNITTVEQLEKDLLRSGLFTFARITVSNAPDALGNLPVRIELTERPYRTMRAGVSYRTDQGFGGEAGWENRDLFGEAEALTLTLFASEVEYGARGTLSRPDILSRGTDGRLEAEGVDENTDAYNTRRGRLAAVLEKRLAKTLTLSGGVAYELETVEQQEVATRHGFASVPLSAAWDGRDDKLDPSRGTTLRLATTPYQDVLNNLAFVKSLGEASLSVRISRAPPLVVAARATLGSITGAAGEDVPADKRFYAGGGGTIRGYPYQSVGELNEGEPVGGKSLATVSGELRARISPTLGAALFVDGGTAYPGSSPDSETPFLWGAGVGVRYYLGFAPLRADIAFPLQRRDDVDDPFQVYVSLGQSF